MGEKDAPHCIAAAAGYVTHGLRSVLTRDGVLRSTTSHAAVLLQRTNPAVVGWWPVLSSSGWSLRPRESRGLRKRSCLLGLARRRLAHFAGVEAQLFVRRGDAKAD